MNKNPQVNQAMMILLAALLLNLSAACTQDTRPTTVPMPTRPTAEIATTEHPHPHPEGLRYVLKCSIGLVDEEDTSYRSAYPKDADYQDIAQELLAELNNELLETDSRQAAEEIQSYMDNLEECLQPYSEGPQSDRNCAIAGVSNEVSFYKEVSNPTGEAYQEVAREMLADLNDELDDTANRQAAEEIQSSIDHIEECLNL